MLAEACRKSFWASLWIALREFVELPVNALDERLGSLRRSGYMLQALRALSRPVWRILRNAALLETAVLLVISLLSRLAGWNNSGYSFVLFFVGVFILIMAGLSFSGSRRSGFFGLGTNRFAIPSAEPIIQLMQRNLPYELPDRAWLGLAGFLHTYASPISIALAGICTIFIGIKLGN
jgi:hypothetical protein